jgi:hypothetical protein
METRMARVKEIGTVIAQFIREWGAIVSGGLTVPFTLAGLYADPQYAKTIWFCSAAFAGIVAFYLDHASNRAKIRELKEQLEPKLKLSYALEETVRHQATDRCGKWMQTFVCVTKKSEHSVANVQIKLVGAKIQKDGSWQKTQIISSPNMSWGSEVDDEPSKKYSTRELTTREIIDFITGPFFPDPDPSNMRRGVQIRFDQRHRGMSPNFYEYGKYKFVIQATAPNAPADEMTLYVDWNTRGLTISTEAGEILESFR